MIIFNDVKYDLIENYRDSFNKEDFDSRVTEDFLVYDYIVGDYAYSKLRLKGFYDSKNPKCSKINDYKNLDDYLKNNCAYGCKYFVLKKIIKKN